MATIDILSADAITGAPAMFPGATTIPGGVVLSYSTVPDGWPGGEVHAIRSIDGGVTWSQADPVGVPVGEETAVLSSTGLMRRSDGTLLQPLDAVTWEAGTGTEHRKARLRLARSTDDGATWGPAELVDVPFHWPANYGDLIEFEDGEILWPVWGIEREGEKWRSTVISSLDGGDTWTVKGSIAYDPNARLLGEYVDTGNGANSEDDDTSSVSFRPHDPTDGFTETSIIELQDGRLFAVLRQQGVDGDQTLLFFGSYSSDRGATWTPYRSLGFTGMSPALHRFPDGRLLLAYRRTAPDGSGLTPAVDVRLASADGASWSDLVELQDPHGARLVSEYQVGYPTIVETDDPQTVDVYFYSFAEGSGRYIARNRVRVTGAS